MRRPMSLQRRLTLAVGLLSAAVMALFALLAYQLLQAHLLGAVDARLEERAAYLTQRIDADPGPAASEPWPAQVLAAVESAAYDAELISPDGELRARSPSLSATGMPIDQDLLAAAQGGQAVLATVVSHDGTPLRLRAGSLQSDGQPGGILLVAESIAPEQGVLARLRLLLAACGALLAGLACGATALLSDRILAPMTDVMRAGAAIVSGGHYDQRVPMPDRSDEVGQFAQTINTLIAAVEHTLRQQREFLANTSHELRSPLTVVLANLNLLRRDLDAHERELSIDEATTEAQRMRRLINELLLLAQADAAQVIAQAPVRLDRLVEHVVAAVQRQAPGHHYHVRVAGALTVVGDHERLTQLLRNLLENAAQHTPPGTTVEVCLRRQGSVALLSVRDTGPGIAAAHLPQLWDRYYRADKVRSRASGGTGLGLPIVKYIAEAHGGRAHITSEVGAGTTFTVELPLAPDAPEPAAHSAEV